MPKHPHQPIEADSEGTKRFKTNHIVEYLLDTCRYRGIADMNTLAMMKFSPEDRVQFAQLIGYSVNGFEELSYVSDEVFKEATTDALR